jgi:hypothetical protein
MEQKVLQTGKVFTTVVAIIVTVVFMLSVKAITSYKPKNNITPSDAIAKQVR